MKRLLQVFLVFVLLLTLTAATKVDTRKVALALENLPSGWIFESKGASIKSTNRWFKDAAGSKIIVTVTQHKSKSSAQFQFYDGKGDDLQADIVIPRPAPLRQVDDYYAAAIEGSPRIIAYSILKGDMTFHIVYWGKTFPNASTLLQCEALQLDRLAKPNQAGICGIKAQKKK